MKSSIEFSAVVHSATAYLDFRSRLLARPAWFTDEDASAIMELMRSAKVRSTRLPERERWLHMSNDRMVVFGVVAMSSYFSDDMTHEMVMQDGHEVPRRENDAFVGFAAPAELVAGRAITPVRDRSLFRDVYAELVGPRWLERHAAPDRERPTISTPRRLKVEATPLPAPSAAPRHVVVFPHAQADEAWQEATSRKLNVVLGLPSARDATGSQHVDVATVGDVDQRTEVNRETKHGAQAPSPAGDREAPGRRGRAPAGAPTNADAAAGGRWHMPPRDDEPAAPPKAPLAFFAVAVIGVALVAIFIAAIKP